MDTACQLSKDQFLCPICRNVFTEPITLPCAHNFCMKCVDQHWSANAKCMCPHCKKLFFFRPELKVNIFIAKIADRFIESMYKSTRSLRPQPSKPRAVLLCDVCPGPKQRAHKSCLLCLSSYCESHLKPHLDMCGLKKHQLMELQQHLLMESMGNMTLKEHQLLEPQKHQLMEPQPGMMLQDTEADIQEKISRRMKKIDELRNSVRVSNDAADREISDGVKVFTALKESVERGLELLISETTRKKAYIKQQAEDLIRELEQEINELEKMEAEAKLPPLLNSKISELEKREPEVKLHVTKDWTHDDICSWTHEGAVVRALSELQQDFNKKTRSLFEAELKRVEAREDTGTAQSQCTDQFDFG